MLSVMLIDDERSTVEGMSGILRRYPGEFRIAGAFTSPLEALETLDQLQGHADVVITDVRMPALDGMALLHILRRRHPCVRTVVLSGFPDFEYVRECMKSGAVDYLLKPCRYQTLLEVLRKLHGEKNGREADAHKRALLDGLRGILLGGLPDAAAPLLPYARAHLALFRSAKNAVQPEKETASLLAGMPPKGMTDGQFLTLDLPGETGLIADASLTAGAFEDWVSRTFRTLFEQGAVTAASYECGLESGSGCLVQAAARLRRRADFAEFNHVRTAAGPAQQETFLRHTREFSFSNWFSADSLEALLYQRDRDGLLLRFNRMCAELSNSADYLDPVSMKKQAVGLFLETEQVLARLQDPQKVSQIPEDYIHKTDGARTARELLQLIRRFLCDAADSCGASQAFPRYITDAVHYIRTHYMKELRLSDVAEKVFLNEWYLSSQFKKHTGMTFREYLNSTRIQAARELLRQPDLKVAQIAELVGFTDAAYFAATFKGLEGRTPKEYQKLFSACRAPVMKGVKSS